MAQKFLETAKEPFRYIIEPLPFSFQKRKNLNDGGLPMNQDSQQPISDDPIENPPAIPSGSIPATPSVLSDEPKKNRKKLWTIVGIVSGILACCCVAGVATLTFLVINAGKEKAPIEKVLDAYMYAMAVKSPERAYELFSPRSKRQFPIAKIEEFLEGNNYVLYEGYQSLKIVNISLKAVANTNPDTPQGTVAIVSGTIAYKDGTKGSFNGTLEKVEDQWRIFYIGVNVPPSKFK